MNIIILIFFVCLKFLIQLVDTISQELSIIQTSKNVDLKNDISRKSENWNPPWNLNQRPKQPRGTEFQPLYSLLVKNNE